MITHPRVCIGIKQPERHIHTLDLINMILIFENFRQQPLAGQVLHQSLFSSFFVQLKRDDQIGL